MMDIDIYIGSWSIQENVWDMYHATKGFSLKNKIVITVITRKRHEEPHRITCLLIRGIMTWLVPIWLLQMVLLSIIAQDEHKYDIFTEYLHKTKR